MNDPRKPRTTARNTPYRPTTQKPPIEWPTRSAHLTDNDRAAAYARQRVDQAFTAPKEPATTQNETPVTKQNQEGYDWQRYHAAWQEYYQQYFHRYYAGWWQQQKAQQHETPPQTQVVEEPPESSIPPEQEQIALELRQKIRGTVEKRAKKIKSSHHFKPIIAAFSVALFFLLVNYNQIMVGAIKQYIAPGNDVTTPVIVEPSVTTVVGPEPKIIIPKIGVEAPVIYDEPRVDEASFQSALDKGVVRLGNTPDPGTRGNTVLGGHSSNNIFNSGGYKFVFVNLKRLDVGDIIYLNFEGIRYTYKVTTARKIVSPTDVSVLNPTEKPTLTLFTCDPPGTNINRLIVQAEQIDPNPDKAAAAPTEETVVNESNPLPSVAPSLWDRIFSIF